MSSATQARALIETLLGAPLTVTLHASQAHVLRFASPILTLRESPATSVTSVTVDGAVVNAGDYSLTPFAVVREDGENWPTGRILVTYTTGWTEGEEPADIQEAIALATAWFDTNPGAGVTSFREGAVAATVSGDATGPGVIRALVRKWARP